MSSSVVVRPSRAPKGMKRTARMGRAVKATAIAGVLLGVGLALDSSSVQGVSFVVTSSSGDPAVAGSLPFQVAAANALPGSDSITFDPGVTGTITLDATLAITDDLTITGPGTHAVEIVTPVGAIISVGAGATLTIENVELSDATTEAIDVATGAGGLDVNDVIFSGNAGAVSFDAAVGAISLTDVSVTGGVAGLTGDGADGVTVTGSLFSGLTGAAVDVTDPGVVDISGTTVDSDGAATPLGNGVRVSRPTSVTVTSTSVSGQADIGLDIVGDVPDVVDETVDITGGSFSNNTGGIRSTGTGTIDITGVVVSNNAEPDPSTGTGFGLGVRVADHSAVTLGTITGTGNGNDAIRIASVDSVMATALDLDANGGGLGVESVSGDVTVTGGSFDDNDFTGINFGQIGGATTFDGVTVTGNDNRGISGFNLDVNIVAGQTKVSVVGGSNVSNNGDVGARFQRVGEVEIVGSSFDANAGGGLVTTNAVSVDVDDSDFDDNTALGATTDGFGASFEETDGAVTIDNSDFTGNASKGIQINRINATPVTTSVDVTGGAIESNAVGVLLRRVAGPVTIDTVGFDANSVGMDIDGSANVTVVDSTFSEHSSYAVDAADSAVVRLERVVVDEGTSLVDLGSGVRSLRNDGVEIIDTSITNQAATALAVTGDSSTTDPEPVTVSGATFSNNTGDGISIQGSNGPIQVNGSTVLSSNTGSGITMSSVGTVAIGPLTADSNGNHGVELSTAGSVTGSSVSASNNTANGVSVTATASLSITNTVSDSIDGNGQHGVESTAATGLVEIGGGTISSNFDEGVRIRTNTDAQSAAHGPVRVTGPTTIDDNGGNGIETSFVRPVVLPPTPTGPSVSIAGATVTNNAQGLFAVGTGPVTIDGSAFDTNELSPGVGDGATILAAAGDVTITSSSFDGNAQLGLDVATNSSPNTTMKLVLEATSADSNGAEGVRANILGELAVLNGSSVSLNGADGVRMSSAVPVRFEASAFDGNAGDGANLGSTSTPVTDVTVSASTLDDNTGNGLQIVAHTGLASVTGGSVSRNAGEPLVSGYGAGLLVGQSASTTGSLLVDGVTVVDNPVGVKTFGASAATVRDVDIDGHTGRAIEITQAGTDVVLTRVRVGNGAAVVPTGTGVLLQTVGSVDVDDLIVTDQTETGLDVDGASGTVDIAGSDLTDNLGAGLLIDSTGGDVAISSTDASCNRTVGVRVDTTDDVTFTSVTANLTVVTPGQSGNGIAISTSENVVVTNSVANDNDGIGVRIDPPFAGTLGAVTVSGGSYSRNGGQGVVVSTATGLTKAGGFSANDNEEAGLLLSNVGDVEVLAGTVVDDTDAVGVSITTSGTVRVTNTTVTDSVQTGMRISGATDVTVTGSTFDRNGDLAADAGLDLGDVAGPVSVQSSFFRSNDALGLSLRSTTGAVRLDGSTFALNVGAGATIGTNSTTVGNVSSVGSTFRDNGETGLSIEGAGDVSLTDTTVIGNYRANGLGGAAAPVGSGAGLELRSVGDVTMLRPTVRLNGGLVTTFPGGPAVDINTAADVSITGGSISDNHAGGVQTFFTGDIALSETVFADNDSVGFLMVIGGGVDLDGVTVSGHPGNGVVVNSPSDGISIVSSTFGDNGSTALDVSGLTAAEGSLTIGDSEFTDNQSALRLNASSAATTVTGSTFTSNPFALYGEVVGGLTVVDSTFESNGTAVRWYGVSGGLDVSSSSFVDNNGRAFEFVGATGGVSIARTTVTGGNQPSLFDTVTGAVTVDRSSFVENGSLARGTPASAGSAAAFDSADRFAGLLVAIDVAGGVEITTSTFTDNEVSTPLIAAEGTDITVRHSTIADNASQTQIGSDGAVVVDHSIVMGRAARSSFDATDVTATFSVLAPETGLGGSTVEAPDPLLEPLARNGTGTPSRYPLEVSPAVSVGNPSITSAPATDQTGAARIESVIDAGAVEFDPTRVQPDDSVEPLSPARFVDTREVGETLDGRFVGDGKLDAGDEYRVTIAGRGDVPADAAGVIVNVTAVAAERNGFVTVHPCVTPRPVTSSLNYTAGVNLGNEIVAGLSDTGELCLFTSGPAHLTVDVTGYVPPDTAIELITPIRMMDTRPGQTIFDDIGALGAKTQPGSNTFLLLATRGGIPRGTSAVILNVTAVGAESNGFVTVHPCVDPAPTASSLNHVAGVNRGNELVASLDSGGRICIFTSASIHLTVDVVGYVPPDIGVEPVDPARVLDTRPGLDTVDGIGEGAGKLAAGEEVTLQIGGRADVPENARAAIVNVTAIGAESNGFVTVHPCVDPRPLTSSLNYVAGVNGGNEIVALLDEDGRMCLFSSGAAHLAVDVAAWLR